MTGRALDDDDAGAGFACGERGAEARVAATEYGDVVRFFFSGSGKHGSQL